MDTAYNLVWFGMASSAAVTLFRNITTHKITGNKITENKIAGNKLSYNDTNSVTKISSVVKRTVVEFFGGE